MDDDEGDVRRRRRVQRQVLQVRRLLRHGWMKPLSLPFLILTKFFEKKSENGDGEITSKNTHFDFKNYSDHSKTSTFFETFLI